MQVGAARSDPTRGVDLISGDGRSGQQKREEGGIPAPLAEQESLLASHLGGRREDGPTVGVSGCGERVVVEVAVGVGHAEGGGRVGIRGGRESVGGCGGGRAVEVEERVVVEGRGGGRGGRGLEGGGHSAGWWRWWWDLGWEVGGR